MSFSVEDYAIEIKGARRREKQVKIFEGFGEEKALHRIVFLFGDHAFQRGIPDIITTVLHEVAPKGLAHCLIMTWV